MGDIDSAAVAFVAKSMLGAILGIKQKKAMIVIVIAPSIYFTAITYVAIRYGKVVSIVAIVTPFSSPRRTPSKSPSLSVMKHPYMRYASQSKLTDD
jgi:hypothetical protein